VQVEDPLCLPEIPYCGRMLTRDPCANQPEHRNSHTAVLRSAEPRRLQTIDRRSWPHTPDCRMISPLRVGRRAASNCGSVPAGASILEDLCGVALEQGHSLGQWGTSQQRLEQSVGVEERNIVAVRPRSDVFLVATRFPCGKVQLPLAQPSTLVTSPPYSTHRP
jgi:hypothetical protein